MKIYGLLVPALLCLLGSRILAAEPNSAPPGASADAFGPVEASGLRWLHLSSRHGDLPVPTTSRQQTAALVVDLDTDGVNDIVLGFREKGPALVGYRHTAHGWDRYVIEKEFLTIEAGGAVCDIDGDGYPDLVFGGDWQSNKVWWWRNPGKDWKPDVSWERHTIKRSGATQHHDQCIADFKGTGRPQLAYWNQGAKTLFVADIPARPREVEEWPAEQVFSGTAGENAGKYAEGMSAYDIDGDGRPELLAGNYMFKYTGPGKWTATKIGDIGGLIFAGRFNKEAKHPQVVIAPGDGSGPVKWYECMGNPLEAKSWRGHDLVGRVMIHPHSLQVADIDGDGNLDIFVAEMAKWSERKTEPDNPRAQAFIFFGDGKGNFRKTVFQTGMGFHEVRVADLDGDGRPDILSKPYNWDTPRLDIWLNQGSGDMRLWYRQPADKWLDAMPLGNGLMGAMVFGGTGQERIALNESSFWSGRPHDYNDPQAGRYFVQVRDLVFAGKFQEAERLADEHFYGVPKAQQAYQPLGDLLLTFEGQEKATDYRRELDMETGIAKVQYRAGGTTFTREVFVSYPDRAVVVRITADQPGKISVQARLKSSYMDRVSCLDGKRRGTLVMDGCWKGPMAKDWLIAPVEGRGERFQAVLAAVPQGGRLETSDATVTIKQADSVTLLITAATSFVNYHDISGDPAAACEKVLAAVREKDYATLRRRHEDDFRGLMGRVHVKVGDPSLSKKPIDERLQALRDGGSDPNLEALAFQAGRYFLASSSRAGGQPANLQGIWNESVTPSWGSKYTININTQMNYWPAEVCNLSECHQPLFDMLEDAAVTGSKTAKVYYGCGGWVAHHNLDLWRGTAPVDAARFGMWPVGGAWLCQHLWEHYAFTGDRQFLKRYYPVMKGAAQFLLEVLTEEPRHHWLVTPFSMSPEHGYIDANGKLAFLSPAPTMDVAIIRELFPHCIEAGRILGVDEEFRGKLAGALKRLPPYRLNRSGYLQEWIDDWKPGDQGHNCSPNFTFYPGCSIQLRRDAELAAAIGRWMENRRSRGGWPAAWDISVWARLERGDKVAAILQNFLRGSVALSLHNRGANQSDASFGYTAGVAEALVQSHAGEISLLPALPASWGNGSVTGLRARGGFEVNMEWKDSKLTRAEIRHATGAECKLRYGAKTAAISVKPGQATVVNANLAP